jgi:uncharacterized cupin superfamily protein
VREAELVETGTGLARSGDGWFVVNVGRAAWYANEAFGAGCDLEGDVDFSQIGVNLRVLWPGQPNCMYHGESEQEDFLVLFGGCVAVIEDEERHLSAWDYVHCPPDTRHVLIGAGEGPCVVLMIGSRRPGRSIVYPVSELAQAHGAGVDVETTEPKKAYASYPEWHPEQLTSDGLPWA